MDEGHPVLLDTLEEDRLAHAVDREDDLDDDRATHEVADPQTEDGHGGDEGIAQDVTGDDDPLRDTGAEGGTNVVAVQLFNHRGAHDPGHLADDGDGEGDGGQQHAQEPTDGIVAKVRESTGDGKHLDEGHDEEGSEPEGGGANRDDRENTDQLVGPGVPVEGSEHAEWERDEDREEQAEEGELHGDRERGADEVGNPVSGADPVCAEVPVEHSEEVVAVLDEQRVLEPMLDPVGLEGLGARRFTEGRIGRVDR
ncbi:Uncharacterised protein [Chlamydia trachomatis]|nr:Uncharacterised protein [Chlamydia trachomatis]